MRPGERGGVVLEGKAEEALALNTLTAALLNVGAGVSSDQGHNQFRELSLVLRKTYEAGGSNVVELDDLQTGQLRDACKVATANTQFALGVLSCFRSMTGLPEELVPDAARRSKFLVLNAAALIAEAGPAASELSGLLELYGRPETSIQ
jgi:hypothetical protein